MQTKQNQQTANSNQQQLANKQAGEDKNRQKQRSSPAKNAAVRRAKG